MTENGPRYPLYCAQIGHFSNGKPNILLTAGVHGYEPSAVEAALLFLEEDIENYKKDFNFLVYPCLSPWAYEYDHRWNAFAEDPNRLFAANKPWADECRWFMQSVAGKKFDVAIDGHETLDRDIQLRKSRASRFGTQLESYWQAVPQGFYLMVSDSSTENADARKAFARAIINGVSAVSPIAPENDILGKPNLGGFTMFKPIEGTMRGFLNPIAKHVGITEVYPDYDDITPEKAVLAQLAAFRAGIEFAANMR